MSSEDNFDEISDMEHALSVDRFSRYMEWANGDRRKALALYCENVVVSEAFYTPLHFIEIALRNRFHAVLRETYGEQWYLNENSLRAPHQELQVAEAILGLEREEKEVTPGRVVAALTFGFWATYTNIDYENDWRKIFHRVGSKNGRNLSRKDLSGPLRKIRTLRNRIAHHEPILYWSLAQHHDQILEVTGWLSPVAATLAKEMSRVPHLQPFSTIPRR
ncbi:Abi family protein [Pararhodospirillum oryzae]|uniref:Abi family protein n=1 Tax=Pararhodospirillum oryzae TaxID=478448 RepID=A0A512HAN1_9PROT|nr:Abi family protein [Pararhodospirillum oryzae]GEO82509.1 hypothetical protein ROR02_26400 [Pararhodospirillum oryzae]